VLKTYGDAGPIALLFVLESIIFVAQVISDVAPYYPPHSDQVGYLFESYKFTQQMKHEGLGAALLQLIQPFQPQGFLLPLQGGLMGLFIGLPRLGALTVNLLYFLLLQAVVFITFKRISGDRLVAWTAIALVLLMSAPFYWAGGIFDFRLDFAALCLFGIWCCVVLRSDWYLGTYWSVIAGIVGAWLVCTRYFSILYVGTIMIMIFQVEKRADQPSPFDRASASAKYVGIGGHHSRLRDTVPLGQSQVTTIISSPCSSARNGNFVQG
jgi:hypothetical protein